MGQVSCIFIGIPSQVSHPSNKNQEITPQCRLKVISTISVGYEHIDLEATRRLGIQVGYTPDVLSEAVAELTVGMTIMALRRLREVCFWFTG